ncbi:MAG: HAD family hydrolase [Acidobacteria bacterium]|nr:MAG: HAD family hydrolase [Acidobacteriota bacterium]REK02277.1 MAG: HAD family hydrolase [Acidobacteriota bacterium]REK13920.1 MAG: HAD family hydrolase [Acidobacteriota bacterium]REK41914.1 MAG: HAD family hydrolase [Acidobacteriota bacterium]
MGEKKKAVFFDRDGTLIEEVDFLATVEETNLFPYTIEALGLLKVAGFSFVVVTNQSGIARGYFDANAVNAIHEKIRRELEASGIEIESFHFCPHLPDAGCECRKPNTGMIRQAMEVHEYDLKQCWMIGDKELDIGLGKNAGTRTALVRTGYGSSIEDGMSAKPDIVADDLLEAAKMIVGVKNKTVG